MGGSGDCGLYQLYGFHPIYGADVLLYLGKTSVSFAHRVVEDRWALSQDKKRLQVYVGRIDYESGNLDQIVGDPVDIAERLLIKAHLPVLNITRNFDLSEQGFMQSHIFNWGTFRSLFPEVSGSRWSDRFWK